MPILSTSQSRWFLSIVVGVFSTIAISSSASTLGGGASMFSGRPGDIRGMGLMLGVAGLLVVVICRIAHVILPRPWRLYSDRVEFTSIATLWICWTSATMSFSAFTLGEGVCSASSSHPFELPTCPLLTFDLALLHLLSTSTLASLLVILSTALSPGYAASLSSVDGKQGQGDGGLIMWEMAIDSPPSSPTISPLRFGEASGSGYGAVEEIPTRSSPPPGLKKDKSRGGLIIYALLLLISLGVVVSALILMTKGEFVVSTIIMTVIGVLSAVFAGIFLHIHRRNAKLDPDRRSLLRSLEVGSAISLFILWPLAAISFTLFPSIPNRACDNPASSVTGDTPEAFTSEDSTCLLSFTVITLAWVGAWIVFSRLLGIVFPLPHISPKSIDAGSLGEGSRLLAKTQIRRPQVGYGRIVAGEAFELGDEDE